MKRSSAKLDEVGVEAIEEVLCRQHRNKVVGKALVKSRPEAGLWLEQVPVPEIGINDVLIKEININTEERELEDKSKINVSTINIILSKQ